MATTTTTTTTTSSPGGGGMQLPFVEKYRPRLLRDIVGNQETVQRLRAIAQDGNCPNIILSGPPGSGKTTSVLALAREMLGAAFGEAVLELNASDDRGIGVVRNKIKQFAQKKVTLPPGRHKLVILDEADSMTAAAQQAMRRIMEIYSSSTRFALACNTSSNIIEPLQSRCAILRYSRLSEEELLARLLVVCREEHIPYTDQGLEAILFNAEGDMRNALNSLQATFAGFGKITDEHVHKVCDVPHPVLLQRLVNACLSKHVNEACDIAANLMHQGYSAFDVIGTLFKVVKNATDIDEALKLEMIKEIGVTHMRIADGVDSVLQMTGLCARLTKLVVDRDSASAAAAAGGGGKR